MQINRPPEQRRRLEEYGQLESRQTYVWPLSLKKFAYRPGNLRCCEKDSRTRVVQKNETLEEF